MISYKDSLINEWTKNESNLINICALRKVYSDVYFENHKNKTTFQREENRIRNLINRLRKNILLYENRHNYYKVQEYENELQSLNKENDLDLKMKRLMMLGRSVNANDSSIYRIIKQYGYKVPMSNGLWKYDPSLNEKSNNEEKLYFQNLCKEVIDNTNRWFSRSSINNKLKLEIIQPSAFHYGMTINCCIKNDFIEIPLRINLRRKSVGIYNPFKQEVEITFHDSCYDYREHMFDDFELSISKILSMFVK